MLKMDVLLAIYLFFLFSLKLVISKCMVLYVSLWLEWVLKALSCERMRTAYQGISLRMKIMGLLKLHNCILLFLSFTFALVLQLIPRSPSDESCFPFL